MVTIPRTTEPTVKPRPISPASSQIAGLQGDVSRSVSHRGRFLEQTGKQLSAVSDVLGDISLKIKQDQDEETSVLVEKELIKPIHDNL